MGTSNLQEPLTPLIGREQEVASVLAQFRRVEVRLLTVTGPPGVGKTRLGLQVAGDLAADFPAGFFFVSRAPVHDSNLVAPTIA